MTGEEAGRNDLAWMVIACANLGAIVTLVWPSAVALRVALEVPVLFLGQGYLASRLLRRPVESASLLLMLSIALSFAVLILGGLVLAIFGNGSFSPRTVILCQVVFATAVGAYVTLRDRGLAPRGAGPWPSFRCDRSLVGVTIACAITFAILFVWALRPISNSDVAGYSLLWGHRDTSATVSVGLRNERVVSESYRAVVGDSTGFRTGFEVVLSPGEQVIRTVRSTRRLGNTVRVWLYHGNVSEPQVLTLRS
jgi:hypothetical protein